MIVDTMDGCAECARSFAAETTAPHRPRSGGVARGTSLLAVLALPALLLAGGCGASRPIKYYQLTAPGESAPASAQSLPVTIVVPMPVASDLYRDNRIVYGIGEQEMGTYEYQRWVGPPAEMIQTVLIRELRASGHYAGVFTPQARAAQDYALTTHIYDFKEQDSGSTLVGKLSMDVQLRNLKTGAIVWKTYFTHDEPIAAKTVPDVAAALNRDVQLAASTIASGMEQYFASNPPK